MDRHGQPRTGSPAMVAGICQSVPPPATPEEFVALVVCGVFVDLTGQPLVWTDCGWCGCRVVVGSTCPISLACTHSGCGARAGRWRCRRPSGHDAAALHRARTALADQIDEDRIAAASLRSCPHPGHPARPGAQTGSPDQLDLFASLANASRP